MLVGGGQIDLANPQSRHRLCQGELRMFGSLGMSMVGVRVELVPCVPFGRSHRTLGLADEVFPKEQRMMKVWAIVLRYFRPSHRYHRVSFCHQHEVVLGG